MVWLNLWEKHFTILLHYNIWQLLSNGRFFLVARTLLFHSLFTNQINMSLVNFVASRDYSSALFTLLEPKQTLPFWSSRGILRILVWWELWVFQTSSSDFQNAQVQPNILEFSEFQKPKVIKNSISKWWFLKILYSNGGFLICLMKSLCKGVYAACYIFCSV